MEKIIRMPQVPNRMRRSSIVLKCWDAIYNKLSEERVQKKVVLAIVCIALLLDNMLYMVIVPIIPDYLREIGVWGPQLEGGTREKYVSYKMINVTNATGSYAVNNTEIRYRMVNQIVTYKGEEAGIGLMIASKALVQLLINPLSGTIIDRVGYDKPFTFGLLIMFFSTVLFAIGQSYTVLFFARSLQGVGAAFADTSGLAMIADTYTDKAERSKAFGIALAFISFGCLVAPPFGGTLYHFCGKQVPFLILAFVSLLDVLMLRIVMCPIKDQRQEKGVEHKVGTPMWRLFLDPFILICAGCLAMANVSLAFLEPTISVFMMEAMNVQQWQIGMIWLPSFFPQVVGVIFTVKIVRKFPKYQWLIAAVGLVLAGKSCVFLPYSTNYWMVMLSICFLIFSIALINTTLLPLLGHIVDTRHVSVYGSIYAIANISYSIPYALTPFIAGSVINSIGFAASNIGIAIASLIYCPLMWYLKDVHGSGEVQQRNIGATEVRNLEEAPQYADPTQMEESSLR